MVRGGVAEVIRVAFVLATPRVAKTQERGKEAYLIFFRRQLSHALGVLILFFVASSSSSPSSSPSIDGFPGLLTTTGAIVDLRFFGTFFTATELLSPDPDEAWPDGPAVAPAAAKIASSRAGVAASSFEGLRRG